MPILCVPVVAIEKPSAIPRAILQPQLSQVFAPHRSLILYDGCDHIPKTSGGDTTMIAPRAVLGHIVARSNATLSSYILPRSALRRGVSSRTCSITLPSAASSHLLDAEPPALILPITRAPAFSISPFVAYGWQLQNRGWGNRATNTVASVM